MKLVSEIVKQPSPPKSQLLSEAENAIKIKYPNATLPAAEDIKEQRQWDSVICQEEFNALKNNSNQIHCARLLAAASPHSGAWIQALPSSNLGLHLDGESTRIAVALRLGAPVCEPHKCRCGKQVNSLGHHGLSCSKSAGRLPRHSNLNDIIKRSLSAAGIPSWLEPVGLDKKDQRRPDGITVFPFSGGKSLCWDATCRDTFAKTAVAESAIRPGSAAEKAEESKVNFYRELQNRYRFEPLAVETTGVIGKSSNKFISEIGKRISQISGDQRETAWLRQRISIAVVRGNASSILATSSSSSLN